MSERKQIFSSFFSRIIFLKENLIPIKIKNDGAGEHMIFINNIERALVFIGIALLLSILIMIKSARGEDMIQANNNSLRKISLKYSDDEDQEPVFVGMVTITREHALKAEPIDSPYKEFLMEIVGLIDKEPFLHLDASSPTEKGRTPAEQFSRIVKKSDSEYATAVEQTFENTYDFVVIRSSD